MLMDTLQAMLIRHECINGVIPLKPYKCPAGKWTIAVGRNLEDNGITYNEAICLLNTDMMRTVAEAQQFPWFPRLNDARQVAICDMLFNLGLPRFLTFKRMIAALIRDDYETAAEEMTDSVWARQVGTRASELVTIMRTGELL